MNAKSIIKVFHDKNVIEMNTTFSKMMSNPLSDEYALLQKLKTENPGFVVRKRQIKANPHKDTYKGLTYEYMKKYITNHTEQEKVEEAIAELENKIEISKCHGRHLRYPTIKKWFLEKYPEVAQFGVEEGQKAAEDNGNQNVIPLNMSQDVHKKLQEESDMNAPEELDEVVGL